LLRNGKVADPAGKSENLPASLWRASRRVVRPQIPRMKQGDSRIDMPSIRVFIFSEVGMLWSFAALRSLALCGALLLLSAIVPQPIRAEEPPRLDTVVVTAQKIEDPIQTGNVDQEITPVMTTTIEREAFEGKTENIAEIIEKEVGVQIRQSGGLGSYSEVSLRGATSNQVLVFMDGILLNDASGGGVDLSTISLSDVAAIDIYRGATPINFGYAGIGGAVNIRTLRAEKGLKASFSSGYGSFNTWKSSGLINHKPGRFDYLISADYLSSENDFNFKNDNGTQWNPDDDRHEKRNNAQVEQVNLLGKGGYDASETLRFDLMDQFFSKDQGIPSWSNSDQTQTTLDTTRNIATAKLTADDLTAAHLNTSTQLSYIWKEEAYDDRHGHISLREQHSTYTTHRYKADLFAEWLGDWQDLIGTVNYLHETYDSEDHLQESDPGNSRRDSVSFGLQDSLFLFHDSLIVTPAGRYTWLKDKLGAGDDMWGNRVEEQSRSDDYFTPQIGIVYGITDWLKFKSNLAKYVRQPSFYELFGDRGLFLGNGDLKAEKGINFDIGFQGQWRLPMDWLQRLSLGAAYFRNDIDDLIARVYDARGVGRSENVSGALIQGIETSAVAEFLNLFRAIANYTYQDAKNESDNGAFYGKQLPGLFKHSFLGRLEARYAGFTLFGEYLVETDKYYDAANLLPAADKKELNAGISWAKGPWVLQLEGKNIADKQYEDFNGYPLPGRSIYASVKYTFETKTNTQEE
jgi:outer membrane cobalamin receptor